MTLHPKPSTLSREPLTLNPRPETRDPNPDTRNPKTETRDPKPETRDPKTENRNLEASPFHVGDGDSNDHCFVGAFDPSTLLTINSVESENSLITRPV